MPRLIAALCATMARFPRAHSATGGAAAERALSMNGVLRALDAAKRSIDDELFLYQTPAHQWEPSSVYRYDDFRESLSVMADEGVAGKKFYMGDEDVNNGHVYGLVNIAAFLAQSMKETIQYDACDENSWDLRGGKYPLSNACGQLGQSYQDYHCAPEEAHMECPVDPNMSITAVTHAKWYGAPGPLFCGPKTDDQPFSGFWDHIYECNKRWANPPESCDDYEGQKAGRYDQSTPYANAAGRTDVESCCWWGRGVIQTSGVCNFGKLNFYLGARAKEDGRPAKYPQVDFCKDPEVICASNEYKELKWIAGEFYWMESVQSYNEEGWDYTTELRKFVDGGMTGTSFIDGVSGIVNRGCHNPPCGTGPVDGGWERAENFKKVLDVFFDGSPPRVGSSPGDSPGSPVESGSSTGSDSGSSGRWYPDYNAGWALGKCVNKDPVPSGRPSYDTGMECCQKSYGNQSSGACLSSLPAPDPPSDPSGSPPGAPETPWAPSPTSDSGSIINSESSTGSDSSGRWYPDYTAGWALGKCLNESPVPSGRPSYDTGIECCQKSYGNQASGKCLSSLPAPNLFSAPSGSPPGPSPQTPPTTRQPVSATSGSGIIINSETFIEMENTLDDVKDEIDNKLFLYQTPAHQWEPSSVYRYDDFKESLFVMATEGVAGKQFYIGESEVENGHVYGLVNIAAFLAQSMKETIQYDACDENSWDLRGGKYPLSNACGQLGQSYQDYHCSPEEAHMECPVDPDMSITAVTHAKWYGAPGPLFCGPKTEDQPFSGFWDHIYECNKGWANPPESCDDYEGQKAGRYDQSTPYANAAGRTDVESCCWWGRGVIQTSGVCNFGKLNFYLGARAKEDGRPAKYPQVDFCKDPEVICASNEYKELKWIAGEFYWMESVQTYNMGGWDYITELRKFVDGGMTGTSFIDGVSGIVNRGCHNPPCGTGPVDGGWERAQNFKKVLDVFFGGSPPKVGSSPGHSLSGSPGELGSSAGSNSSGRWYPDYSAGWALGRCTNEAPIPSGRPSYDTGMECCQKAYGNQASGSCFSSLQQQSSASDGMARDTSPGTSVADVFATSMHARQQSNFIAYTCGGITDIPVDSLVVDILYDYEVFVAPSVQSGHILPDLKNQIMNDLAHSLGCRVILRRNLRNNDGHEMLLGLHFAEGSDVIDGKKGSCTQTDETDGNGETCFPAIGHLTAFIQRDSSADMVLAVKDVILDTIQNGMTSNNDSNLIPRLVYVGEHGSSLKHQSNISSFVENTHGQSHMIYIIIGIALVLVAMLLGAVAIRLKRKQKTIPLKTATHLGVTSKHFN